MPPATSTDTGSRLAILELNTDLHGRRLDDLHERIREVEPRVLGGDSLLGRIKDQVEKSEVKVTTDIAALNTHREAHDRRIDRLETKLAIGFALCVLLIPVATQALGWVREVYLPTKVAVAEVPQRTQASRTLSPPGPALSDLPSTSGIDVLVGATAP